MRFKEYPGITIPQCLIDLKFEDESWHNDSAARATRKLPNGTILVAWVDYEDNDKRENSDGPRFGIQLLASEDSYGVFEQTISVMDTNDEKELSDVLTKTISCFKE